MARGITEAQVHAAADALVAAGERPTVERIRAHLGSGSPNTVTKLLDRWWAGLGPRLAALAPRIAVPEAPDAIQRLAGELWVQAVATARGQAEAALLDEREALEQARTALAAEQAQGAEAIAAATQARAAADQAQTLAEARLVETQRRAEQLEAQVADLTEQRNALAANVDRLEEERVRLREQLQVERAAITQEREAQAAHGRAVEDRAHAEVDRARQDVQDLRAQLRSIARERGQERDTLEAALRQARTDLSTVQRELARQTGRAEALERTVATHGPTAAAGRKPATVRRGAPSAAPTKPRRAQKTG